MRNVADAVAVAALVRDSQRNSRRTAFVHYRCEIRCIEASGRGGYLGLVVVPVGCMTSALLKIWKPDSITSATTLGHTRRMF